MICDKQIFMGVAAGAGLRPFKAGTFRVKKFAQKHTLPTGCTLTFGFLQPLQFPLAHMQARFGLHFIPRENQWTAFYRLATDSIDKASGGQGQSPLGVPMACHACDLECDLEEVMAPPFQPIKPKL